MIHVLPVNLWVGERQPELMSWRLHSTAWFSKHHCCLVHSTPWVEAMGGDAAYQVLNVSLACSVQVKYLCSLLISLSLRRTQCSLFAGCNRKWITSCMILVRFYQHRPPGYGSFSFSFSSFPECFAFPSSHVFYPLVNWLPWSLTQNLIDAVKTCVHMSK